MLKNSARNWTLYFSRKRVFLIKEKSVLMRRGPRRLGWLSESFGIVKAGAAAKQAVLNQWLSVCPLERTGLHRRFARPLVYPKSKIPVLSGAVIRIGRPLWKTEMPLVSQPPSTVAAIPWLKYFLPCPTGKS